MRLKGLIVVSAIVGLLAFGALSFAPLQTFAQGPTPASPTCDSQASDTTEVTNTGADTVDLQCGDQTTPDANAAPEVSAASAAGPDTANVQNGPGAQVEDGQPDGPAAAETPDLN